MREILLLRWCQASVLLCGVLLIAIGSGVAQPWLPMLVLLALSGTLTGALYEKMRRVRGESEGFVPLLLPALGGISGAFVLITHF